MLFTRPVAVASVVSVFAVAVPATQQRDSSHNLVGVWKIVETSMPGPGGAFTASAQPNIQIFTARHYSVTTVRGDTPRPIPPGTQRTDKQLADAFRSFAARAGTYEIKGDEIVYRPLVTMDPGMMGPDAMSIDSFKLDGDTLWLTHKRTPAGPTTNPPTLKLTRLE